MAKMKELVQVAFIVMAVATTGYNVYTGATVQKIGIPGVFEVVIGPSEPENNPEPTRPAPANPTDTPVPIEPPLPTAIVLSPPAIRERIKFSYGSASHAFTTILAPGTPKGYLLNIRKHQRMYITIPNSATIAVFDPKDNPLALLSDGQGHYEILIPETGDYTVVLAGEGEVAVTIYIPPL